MTRFQLTVPARISILGNPGDANEGDFATLSAAVDLFAYADIQAAADYTLEQSDSDSPQVCFRPSDLPLPYDGTLDLLKGAVNRLVAFSPELQEKLLTQGFHLRVRSDVPRQSGLGGSSLFVLLALAALRELYALDRCIHNDYILSELCQRVEEVELGITSGFADRYVPLFGGLAYLDYRGKLHHLEIRQEPLVSYERLDGYAASLPLVAVTTSVQHDSGDVHGRMRPRYLDEHAGWQKRGGEVPPMVRFMSAAWETAWRGKIALLEGDLKTIGCLMNENHRLVDDMMLYCGFPDGAGRANNLFIESALQNGALGAKLTGAGGGGSVFALVEPGQEKEIVRIWQETAEDNNLPEAQIYPLNISPQGLHIKTNVDSQ
jgi:galactokinase/mevalonate kinase-like predicted kinase